jgi:hypothetical protein
LILLSRETNAFMECILEHDREHIGVRAEIWGWKAQEGEEQVLGKYLRGV